MHDRDLLYWGDGKAPAGSDQVTPIPNADTGAVRVYTPIAFERWAHEKYNDANIDAAPKLNQGYSEIFLQVKDNWPQPVGVFAIFVFWGLIDFLGFIGIGGFFDNKQERWS